MNDRSNRILNLSPDKLKLLLQQMEQNKSQIIPVQPRHDLSSFPLSPAQRRLWLLHQLDPENTAYNIPVALHLQGRLNITALQGALDALVMRHEILRTTFVVQEGHPIQRIYTTGSWPLSTIEVATQRDSAIQKLAETITQQPFSLDTGPLVRATLFQRQETEHILLLVIHHIIFDGWSIEVLIRELGQLYQANLANQLPQLPQLSIQYVDYAVWQNEQQSTPAIEGQINYWKKQLAGIPAQLNLPLDFPRKEEQTFDGLTHPIYIDAELTAVLKTIAQQESATLFMVLMAAYQTLLACYSGQTDIPVGTSIAHRPYQELEHLIGFFVNTMVIRAKVPAEGTFQDLLQQVRQTMLNAYAHQDVPFERVVEAVQPQRKQNLNPLFQVFFVLKNTPEEEKLHLPDLTISSFPLREEQAMFDLTLSLGESNQGLRGVLGYNRDLFTPASIARFADRFIALLTQIAVDYRQPLKALPLTLLPPSLPPVSALNATLSPAALSSHQERIWFIDKFEAGNVYETSPIYHNIPFLWHIKGEVDHSRLAASLEVLVTRHPILRAYLQMRDDLCQQFLAAEMTLPFTHSTCADGTTIEAVKAQAIDTALQPFDLYTPPLWRAHLYILNPQESLLLITIHHLIADKVSLDLLAHDLAVVYADESLEKDLPIQFHNFVSWQENELLTAVGEPLWFYWRWRLTIPIQALELPTSRSRPMVHTFTVAHTSFVLEPALITQMETFSKQTGFSARLILMAGFKLMLYYYAHQAEIVIGMTSANRPLRELKKVVGPLANLIVMRSEIAPDDPFPTFLIKMQQELTQTDAHQAYPFDRLVKELNPAKDMSRTALFDVLFNFDSAPQMNWNLTESTTATRLETNLGYGKYDLNLLIQKEAEIWKGYLVYNADLFDSWLIDQMMVHFRTLLAQAMAQPYAPLGELSLLTITDIEQQLVSWNDTSAAYPVDKTIDQLFTEQANRTPEQTAVIYHGTQLTYREIDARANQLAHLLQAQGVKPNRLVAVCLERCPELVITLLAILKAGGAYLPLDPTYPQARLQFMVADAGACHLVSKEMWQMKFSTGSLQTILWDRDAALIAAQPDKLPSSLSQPHDLIYCLYTSGSTGKPKGVLLQHRNVVRLLLNDRTLFDFNHKDIWTMFHSYCFDFSVWEMYGALLFGGKLVLVPEEVTRDPQQFALLLHQEAVTVLNQTPAAFQILMPELLRFSEPTTIRTIIFGGEALHPVQLRPWREAHPKVKLINMYGITETTVHVTYKEIAATEIESNQSNIGRPIPTTTVYVMDEQQRLLPPGIPGELCVGGDGVGPGYLGQETLTNQRFIQNPYRPEEKIYRSGDLVVRLCDGELLYIGRMDDQVQVRGFRVELNEIQKQLVAHPAVAEAAVLAREDTTGSTEIWAYLNETTAVSVSQLREYLSQFLPHYMIPSHFITLDTLPLTATGKIDRRALLEIRPERQEKISTFVPPQTELEKELAHIWQETLNLQQISIHDSFFDQGGHSLMATQIVSRIREKYQVELPLRHLFERPTIAALAELVTQAQNQTIASKVEAIKPLSRTQYRVNRSATGQIAISDDVKKTLKGSTDDATAHSN